MSKRFKFDQPSTSFASIAEDSEDSNPPFSPNSTVMKRSAFKRSPYSDTNETSSTSGIFNLSSTDSSWSIKKEAIESLDDSLVTPSTSQANIQDEEFVDSKGFDFKIGSRCSRKVKAAAARRKSKRLAEYLDSNNVLNPANIEARRKSRRKSAQLAIETIHKINHAGKRRRTLCAIPVKQEKTSPPVEIKQETRANSGKKRGRPVKKTTESSQSFEESRVKNFQRNFGDKLVNHHKYWAKKFLPGYKLIMPRTQETHFFPELKRIKAADLLVVYKDNPVQLLRNEFLMSTFPTETMEIYKMLRAKRDQLLSEAETEKLKKFLKKYTDAEFWPVDHQMDYLRPIDLDSFHIHKRDAVIRKALRWKGQNRYYSIVLRELADRRTFGTTTEDRVELGDIKMSSDEIEF